ncbi:MAG: hypothetical protein WCA92_19400 [Terriglobales bacterium]|jgi:hypothetical protein
MSYRRMAARGREICALCAMLVACASLASASATLFLEEPYGKMGFFTATGHSAVYLSNVCADSPVVLRRCMPGENGVVISRYDGVDGYDWLAIPLIPYLYAVERPEDIPLFADAKMVAFLRDQYRRKYLENVAPDGPSGETPGGIWYQLVGSSYDRTIYGFEIETTSEQDDALIHELNSSPNSSHFHLVWNNCADFAKHIINFYYPRSLHRSVIADAGITTPKQMAKMLVKFNARHPQIQFSRMVIAQVPGSMPRSSNPHGVVESFFKSKKYILPSALVSPVFAGSVLAVFVGTGAGHFEPDRNAMVFNPDGDFEQPLSSAERKTYQRQFKSLLAEYGDSVAAGSIDKEWAKLQSKAKTDFNDQGAPILQLHLEGSLIRVGASAANVFDGNAAPQLVRQILEARLQSELHHSTRRGISRSQIARDWNLLQRAESATFVGTTRLSAVSSLAPAPVHVSLVNAP